MKENIKINKIITAIGDPQKSKLLNERNIKIKIPDIQYKEGILEYLEKDKNIDYIIIDENLPGNILKQELIKNIYKINNKIKLILIRNNKIDENNKTKLLLNPIDKNNRTNYILNSIKENNKTNNLSKKINENNENNEINYLSNSIKKNNQINILNSFDENKIKEIIKNKKIQRYKINKTSENELVENKIENNKKIGNENKMENEMEKENKKNKIINLPDEKNKNDKESKNFFTRLNIEKKQLITENKKGKIISILGANGIGKSIFSILISRQIKDKKIAIIDFDILNNSLHTLLGIENYPNKIRKDIKIINQNNYKEENKKIYEKVIPNQNKEFEIEKYIIQTKYNIDLISGLNLIFKINEKIIPDKIRMIFKELRKKYDIIIIDTSSECFFDYTREMIRLSDEGIFISGANLLEIKKSQKLLEIYNKEWKIEKNKIKIIFNKCTKNSVDFKEISKAFPDYKIIGKIKLNNYYDYIINNNKSSLKEIKNEITVIKKLIEREKINLLKN